MTPSSSAFAEMENVIVRDPMDMDTTMEPLISEGQRQTTERYVGSLWTRAPPLFSAGSGRL